MPESRVNSASEAFKNGNLVETQFYFRTVMPANDLLYYLEVGNVDRLIDKEFIPKSTRNFMSADQEVSIWEVQTSQKIKESLSDIGAYLISEDFSNKYNLKPYEIGLLSQSLAINHIAQGRWGDAMVEAKKMASREKLIEASLEKKMASIVETQKEISQGQPIQGATYRIEDIGGYPVSFITDAESITLKNSYQNPFLYYLASFIYESQGETSLAAPGYRLSAELKPNNSYPKKALKNLEINVRNLNKRKTADTLFIIETGFMPQIYESKINHSFNVGGSPKIISLNLPVIQRSTDLFNPSTIQINSIELKTELMANIDSLARKNLQDEMPSYVLRATSRAVASLISQYAAGYLVQNVVNKSFKGKNGGITGSIASALVGLALKNANSVDVRHWSTLPAQTYIARENLPIGINKIKYSTPSGVVKTQDITLVDGYNVVYLRVFRNRASILTSNDGNTLPVKSDAVFAIEPSKNISEPSNTVTTVDGEKVGFFDRLKKLTSSQDDTKASVKMPLAPTEVPANSPTNPIKDEDSDSAKGGFFGNLKKLITPTEAPKELPLDVSKSTPLETTLVPATNNVDNSDKSIQPNIFDSVKQFLDKKDSQ